MDASALLGALFRNDGAAIELLAGAGERYPPVCILHRNLVEAERRALLDYGQPLRLPAHVQVLTDVELGWTTAQEEEIRRRSTQLHEIYEMSAKKAVPPSDPSTDPASPDDNDLALLMSGAALNGVLAIVSDDRGLMCEVAAVKFPGRRVPCLPADAFLEELGADTQVLDPSRLTGNQNYLSRNRNLSHQGIALRPLRFGIDQRAEFRTSCGARAGTSFCAEQVAFGRRCKRHDTVKQFLVKGKTELRKQQAELDRLGDQLFHNEQQIQERKRTLARLQKQFLSLEGEVAAAEAPIASAKTKIGVRTKELEVAKQQLEELRTNFQAIRRQRLNEEAEFGKARADLASALAAVRQVKTDAASVRKRVAEAERAVERQRQLAKEQLGAWRKEREALKQKLTRAGSAQREWRKQQRAAARKRAVKERRRESAAQLVRHDEPIAEVEIDSIPMPLKGHSDGVYDVFFEQVVTRQLRCPRCKSVAEVRLRDFPVCRKCGGRGSVRVTK